MTEDMAELRGWVTTLIENLMMLILSNSTMHPGLFYSLDKKEIILSGLYRQF